LRNILFDKYLTLNLPRLLPTGKLTMNKRPQFTKNQNTFLVGQVNGECPICSRPLLYPKNGDKHKGYDIAHIYPLNPHPHEVDLLREEERLSADVNDERNLIPLCKLCHRKFDIPRTVEEYRSLVAVKKEILSQAAERIVWQEFSLKNEIQNVVTALSQSDNLEIDGVLDYDPKSVDEKTKGKLQHIFRRKIKSNVSSYFSFVKKEFVLIEKSQPGLSNLIALQVKLYYEDQKIRGIYQQDIFKNIVHWMNAKSVEKSIEACEIITSFFVQNCEVFS
jgi:hypothetical protein